MDAINETSNVSKVNIKKINEEDSPLILKRESAFSRFSLIIPNEKLIKKRVIMKTGTLNIIKSKKRLLNSLIFPLNV
jgi:hypothetical protein